MLKVILISLVHYKFEVVYMNSFTPHLSNHNVGLQRNSELTLLFARFFDRGWQTVVHPSVLVGTSRKKARDTSRIGGLLLIWTRTLSPPWLQRRLSLGSSNPYQSDIIKTESYYETILSSVFCRADCLASFTILYCYLYLYCSLQDLGSLFLRLLSV